MQQDIRQIGQVPWTVEEIADSLPAFMAVLAGKPYENNDGGMKAPHLFATWFLLRKIQPTCVIESGVWKGVGTWLIEQALPDAQIVCIDPVLDRLVYKSKKARYQTRDFAQTDWANMDKERTLLFFDDHQNCFQRLQDAQKWGFEHIIFEDNYPAKQGDCYSLKKVLMHAGFEARKPTAYGRWQKIWHYLFPPKIAYIIPNRQDALYVEKNCEIYYEFPPVVKKDTTRWGDAWNEADYPTPSPILSLPTDNAFKVFEEEAQAYNWLCYVRLRK